MPHMRWLWLQQSAKDKHNHADFVWRWHVSNFSKILNLQKNQEIDAFYNAIFPTEFTLLWNLKIRSLIDRRIAKLVLDLRLWKKRKLSLKRCVRYSTIILINIQFQVLCLALMFWDLSEAKKLIGSASTNNRNVNFIDNPSNFAIGKSMNNDQFLYEWKQ